MATGCREMNTGYRETASDCRERGECPKICVNDYWCFMSKDTKERVSKNQKCQYPIFIFCSCRGKSVFRCLYIQ